MSDYIEIMTSAELGEGEMHEVSVEHHELLVARARGSVYITDGRCPHLHAHMAEGTLEGMVITCPWHGSQFDISDGRVVRWTDFSGVVKGMAELVRHPRSLRTYEAMEVDGKILVGPEKTPSTGTGA